MGVGARSGAARRLGVRLAVLAVVAGLGSLVHVLFGVGDGPARVSGPEVGRDSSGTSSTSGAPSPTVRPTTDQPAQPERPGDSGQPGNSGGNGPAAQEAGDPEVSGVPSGVAGGVGDRVGLYRITMVTRSLEADVPGHADLAGVVNRAGESTIEWSGTTFALLDSGRAYGTRSVRTADGLRARLIDWVTLRHRATDTPISYVLATLEPESSPGAETANAAYLARVGQVRERLARTSTVVVGRLGSTDARVVVPHPNPHPGVVLRVEESAGAPGRVRARLILQAEGPVPGSHS